jgi:integrase/recombinase XerD
MRMNDAITMYLRDMRSEGRLSSTGSERAYYDTLSWHAEDIGNRDPRTAGRNDVKKTLQRWENPNTQRTRRSILSSFYRWCMEEGYRKDNPALQTRQPKKRPTSVYRLTQDECQALMDAATNMGQQERWAIHIGICAGLRDAELRGLRGRNLERDGFIWVDRTIAKGGRERWVPVIHQLRPVVAEIQLEVASDEFVHCAHQAGVVAHSPDGSLVHGRKIFRDRRMGHTKLYNIVVEAGQRAGIAARVHPHLLRHAYGDHIAKVHGLQIAQALMGHADPSTTSGYTGGMTLDELSATVANTTFGVTPLPDGSKSEEYRYGDSNSGFRRERAAS